VKKVGYRELVWELIKHTDNKVSVICFLYSFSIVCVLCVVIACGWQVIHETNVMTITMIVSLSPTLERGYCVLLTRGHCVSPNIQLLRDRTFAAAATRVWNSLPADLQKAELSYSQFRRSLKTFLFGQSDHCALWSFLFLTAPCSFLLTYLLTYLLTHDDVNLSLCHLCRSVRLQWNRVGRNAWNSLQCWHTSHNDATLRRSQDTRRQLWSQRFHCHNVGHSLRNPLRPILLPKLSTQRIETETKQFSSSSSLSSLTCGFFVQ